MPLDASIILAGRPAPIENPLQMAGQMTQLQGMQQQQAQSAAMNPLVQQEAQAAVQQKQMEIQQAKMALDQQRRMLQVIDGATGRSNSAETPPSSAPPPPPLAAPQSAAILSPAAAAPPATPEIAPIPNAPAGSPDIAPIPNPPPGAATFLQPAASATGSAAPRAPVPQASVPPRAAAPQSTGSGTDFIQKLQTGFQQAGVLPQLYAPVLKSLLDVQQDYVKQGAEYNDFTIKKHSALNGSLIGTFSKGSTTTGAPIWQPQISPQAWSNWLHSAVMVQHATPEDLATIQQAHPEGGPGPTPDELDHYSRSLQIDTALHQQAKDEISSAGTAAKLPEIQAQADLATRANWAGQLAAQTTQHGFDSVIDRMPDDLVKQVNLLTDGQFDPATTPVAIQKWGQSIEQRATLAQQQAALTQRAQYQKATLDLRGAIADQNAVFRQAALDMRAQGKGPTLSPAQIATQEANITKNEASLNLFRLDLGAQLAKRKDAKGVALFNSDGTLTDAGSEVQKRFDGATDALQKQQFRRADVYKIGKPDLQDVQTAQDGEPIEAEDGSVWVKKGGVAFHTGAAGPPATPAAAPPQNPPAAAATPAAAPKSAPPAAAPPPPPAKVMASLPPGEHTFRNGQTWRKNADGSYAFVK